MPTLITTLPQNVKPIVTVTIYDLIAVLPDTLPWPINVLVGGDMARHGQTSTGIIFLTEVIPTMEQKYYFDNLTKTLGLTSTLFEGWMNRRYDAVRFYNEGKFIVDRVNYTYTELPTPIHESPILTKDEVLAKLPKEVPFEYDFCLTGSIAKNGWSCNDADFIVYKHFDNDLEKCVPIDDLSILPKMAAYFSDLLGWKTHVGPKVMPEREPVYLYPVYDQGKWLK